MEKLDRRQSIGVFDSGFGGLTVMQEIVSLLPKENIIYLGDTAHVPYGDKSEKIIRDFSLSNALFLLQKNIKLLVVACHSASVCALDLLQKRMPVPVIGVVSPAIEHVLTMKKWQRIGIIGTKVTMRSGVYPCFINKYDRQKQIFVTETPLLVPLIEEGWLDHPIAEVVLKKYLDSFSDKKIDSLLLACTHYPLLQASIQKLLPEVTIVNSAVFCAKEVQKQLQQHDLLKDTDNSCYQYFFTDKVDKFSLFAHEYLHLPEGEISNERK